MDDCVQYTPITDKATHTSVGIYDTDDALWIAVKGSTDPYHWWSNLWVWKTDFDSALRAHAGFAAAAESVQRRVIDFVRHNGQSRPVFLTGHSRGGAIAALLAIVLRPHVAGLITIGQPPVASGDELATALAGCRYMRLVNGSDVVPRYPKVTYGHAGYLLYMTNEGRCVGNPGWWARIRDRTFRALALERLTDHYAIDYIKEFQSCDTQQS